MEIFYAECIEASILRLGKEDSAHCCRVLRHRRGDVVQVIDGEGTMYDAQLTDDDPAGAEARIVGEHPGWGGHDYHLTMAVCPTKNADRYEWFAEKATELGVDVIQPLVGERSERRTLKTERLRKIALSATKQSLKSLVPKVMEPVTVKAFLGAAGGFGSSVEGFDGVREGSANGLVNGSSVDAAGSSANGFANVGAALGSASDTGGVGLRLIACCFEGERRRIGLREALEAYSGGDVTIMIGPEGDFSPEEVALAVGAGFVPIHLGASRLRTETAAVYAAAEVYSKYL